ncbi:MAG: hypothetical protein L6V93_22250 [Clostridiales bacterium]|nr:MAG: hypothetical protein L6V93_22250 [Clostridiales bacterium]
MTGLSVRKVNIHVVGIEVKEEEKGRNQRGKKAKRTLKQLPKQPKKN